MCVVYVGSTRLVVHVLYVDAVRSFRTLCYTADGQHLLAAGQSKNICIYSVEHQILCKKFEITCNLSFDGTLVSGDGRTA